MTLFIRYRFADLTARNAFVYKGSDLLCIVEVSSPLARYMVVDVTLGVATFMQLVAGAGGATGAAGGDLTGTYPNPTIAADAVTFAKFQNLTTDRLVGRDTAGTGDAEQISVGGGLEFTGGAAIQRSALTGDVSASAGSNSTTVIAGTTSTAGKLQLTDSVASTSTTTAATPNAVKTAYDLAAAALPMGKAIAVSFGSLLP